MGSLWDREFSGMSREEIKERLKSRSFDDWKKLGYWIDKGSRATKGLFGWHQVCKDYSEYAEKNKRRACEET